MTTAYLAFGANIGNPQETYREAERQLAAVEGIQTVRKSELISTKPVGGPKNQPAYFNGCFELETSLAPATLFAATTEIEKALGRKRGDRWGPRIVDLDIALFGAEVVRSSNLMIPHPRMHYRRFVLDPIAELNPAVVHPLLNITIGQLSERMKAEKLSVLVVGKSVSGQNQLEYAIDRKRLKVDVLFLDGRSMTPKCFHGKEIVSAIVPEFDENARGGKGDNAWIAIIGTYEPRKEDEETSTQISPAIDCRYPPTGTPEEYLLSVLEAMQ